MTDAFGVSSKKEAREYVKNLARKLVFANYVVRARYQEGESTQSEAAELLDMNNTAFEGIVLGALEDGKLAEKLIPVLLEVPKKSDPVTATLCAGFADLLRLKHDSESWQGKLAESLVALDEKLNLDEVEEKWRMLSERAAEREEGSGKNNSMYA